MRLITDQDLLDMMDEADGAISALIDGIRVPCRFFDLYTDTTMPGGVVVEANQPQLWCRTADVRFVAYGSTAVIADERTGDDVVYRIIKVERSREGQTMLALSEVAE